MVVISAAASTLAVAVAPSHATFPGKNGLLVYQAQVGRYTQLFTVRPDGRGKRQITHFRDSGADWAQWSSDGKRILFTRHWSPEGGPKEKFQVYAVDADGRALRAVSRPGVRATAGAAWLPDGQHVLYADPSNRFVIATASGAGVRDAGIPGGGSESPCVLADGKRAVLLRSKPGRDDLRAIFIARLDGPGLKRITPWEGIADKIDCSPDGTRIVFSEPEFSQNGMSSNVYTVRTDGTGLVQLTHSKGGTINNGADSWSPDGKRIAFVSNRGGQYQIYAMNTDGSAVTQITRGPEAHLASWGSHS